MPPSDHDIAPSGPGQAPVWPARRIGLAVAALAPLAWALGGCRPLPPLVLAGHPWPGYEPLFLARTLGLLPEGVQLQETRTVAEAIELTRMRRVDGAMMTLDEVLQLRDQGVDLQVVLVFNVSRGADMLLARPGIKTLADLRQKRIGVEDSALGTLMLTLALERAGLQQHQVTVHRIAHPRHEEAWLGGEVDALITYEPVGGRLLSRGAQQLLSTRQLPDTIFDVLAVRRDAAAAHAEHLRACLSSHFQALAYMRQNPWDAAYRQAPRLQVSAEQMIDSLRGIELPDLIGNHRYLSAPDSALLKAVQRLTTIMQQARLIQRPADAGELFTTAYLPRP